MSKGNGNINNSANFIDNLYDGMTYFDQYGGSLLTFIVITIILLYIYAYFTILQEKEKIKGDWVNQRCKPKVMPFAGWLNAPKGVSATQYTSDNFQYCVQNILVNISGEILQPFNYLTASLSKTFTGLTNDVNNSRNMMATLRNSISKIITSILSRLLNVVIPIQRIFISLVDTLNKTQGIMVGSLFTALGSYMTLQSLMGAIMELIIKILVALSATIIGLWAVPVTWPVAASTSAVFLSIAIPLSIIVTFMSEVMHIKTSAVPSLPKMRCFDEDTGITLYNGISVPIKYIFVGDILKNGDVVTAAIKVAAKNLDMYNLDGIIVSETHKIKTNGRWEYVSKHPQSVKIDTYRSPYLYCLNTTSKTINIKGHVFCDWDEIYGGKLEPILKYLSEEQQTRVTLANMHKYVDVGFKENMCLEMKGGVNKYMREIEIGDITSLGGEIYGIVKIQCPNTKKMMYNFLSSDKYLTITHNSDVCDYNGAIDELEIMLNIAKTT